MDNYITTSPRRKSKAKFAVTLLLLALVGAALLGWIILRADSGDPQSLAQQAELSLRRGDSVNAARQLNSIIFDHPTSSQADAARYLREFLRDKEPANHQPITADEARKLGELFRQYEKLDGISGLEDFALGMARITEMRLKARQEILDEEARARDAR